SLAGAIADLAAQQESLYDRTRRPAEEGEKLGGRLTSIAAEQAKLAENIESVVGQAPARISPESVQLLEEAARQARSAADVLEAKGLEKKPAAEDIQKAAVEQQDTALKHLQDAQPSFRLDLGQMKKSHDFVLAYQDVDGIVGQRRI